MVKCCSTRSRAARPYAARRSSSPSSVDTAAASAGASRGGTVSPVSPSWLTHGTPVGRSVLTTGVPWVSQHDETGLTVPPRDSEALADATTELLDDPERRRAYGDRARERVERQFGRERLLDTMETRYRAIAEGNAESIADGARLSPAQSTELDSQ